MRVAHFKQEAKQSGSVQRRQRDVFPHSRRAAHLLNDVSTQMEFKRKNNLCFLPLMTLQPADLFHLFSQLNFLVFKPQIHGAGQPREPQPSLVLALIKGQRAAPSGQDDRRDKNREAD